MVLAGVCFLVAAVAVLVAFLASGNVVTWVAVAVALVALLVAGVTNLRPPVVLSLDDEGYRARGRHGRGSWKQVESVAVQDGQLRFTDGTGGTVAFPLALVDHRHRADLVREVYDRLNTANGYRRFDPAEWDTGETGRE